MLTAVITDDEITDTTNGDFNFSWTRTPLNYVQYYYDGEGNKSAMYTGLHNRLTIAANGSVTTNGDTLYAKTSYTYDVLGRLAIVTDPDFAESGNHTTTYDYSNDNVAGGNHVTITDRNENVTTVTSDVMDRVVGKSVNDTGSTSYSYGYNYEGFMTSTSGGGVSLSETPDALGRLDTEIQTEVNNNVKKQYYYDYEGNKSEFKISVKRQSDQDYILRTDTRYEYDALGRLYKVYEGPTPVLTATYSYDENGNRSSLLLANGVQTNYVYNYANLLTSLTNIKGTTTLSQYTYTYYLDGKQKSKQLNGTDTTTYTYDYMGRLHSIDEPGTVLDATFTYDDYSNRLSMTVNGVQTKYTYNSTGTRLENESDADDNIIVDYDYDSNGNQTVKGGATEGYDGFNKLKTFSKTGTSASYSYGSDGLRLKKTVNNSVTNYIWDGDQLALELDSSYNVVKKYVRGINLIYAEDGSGNNRRYFSYNGHGDVVQLTNSNGDVVKCYNYDAFGNDAKYTAAGNYSDNFTDGYGDGWTNYGGTWSVINGEYDIVGTGGYSGGQKSIIDDAVGDDFTVEADVRMLSDGGNVDAGIIFRVSNPTTGADSYNGYYAALQLYSQRVLLEKRMGIVYCWMLYHLLLIPIRLTI